MINVYEPSLGEEELKSIKETIESKWIGKGPRVKEFEKRYAKQLGSTPEHVITTNCCTEGLFIWPHLFDLKEGDEVILPTISFIGAGNGVCANGLKMILCDVDPRTLNARACDIEKVITNKTKAILLLHYGGIPCEMDEIVALANKYKLLLIEDCAPGICSTYKGKALGTIGDMGMWSFDAMKILVCGDGAALHFKDPAIREKADKWMYFGLETKSGYENSVAQKWWEFDISSFGHRAIMNDLTASIALSQLEKIPSFMEKRKHVNDRYDTELKDLNWLDLPPQIKDYCTTSYYFYHIQVKNGKRDMLANYLKKNGIYTTYRYFPLHRVPGFHAFGSFPGADYATDNTLCLPLHQGLSDGDVDLIVAKIREFGSLYC